MSNLPITTSANICGIDPGFKGAIAVMNHAGSMCKVWDMPVKRMGTQVEYRALDHDGLNAIFGYIRRLPDVQCVLENPTTRPGEPPEPAFRFGRQLGVLETFLYCRGVRYHLVSPMMWKSRLGLDGKTVEGANERIASIFTNSYPRFADLLYGPRGGLLDGRLDALMLCHFLRMQTQTGLKAAIVSKDKKLTPELAALIFNRSKRTKRRLICTDEPGVV